MINVQLAYAMHTDGALDANNFRTRSTANSIPKVRGRNGAALAKHLRLTATRKLRIR